MENPKNWFLNRLLNKNYSIEFFNFQLFCGPDIVLYNCEIKNGGHRLTFSIIRLKLVKICIFSQFRRPIGRADNLAIIHYASKRWTRAWCRMPNAHFFRNHKHDVTWSCDFPQDFTHIVDRRFVEIALYFLIWLHLPTTLSFSGFFSFLPLSRSVFLASIAPFLPSFSFFQTRHVFIII